MVPVPFLTSSFHSPVMTYFRGFSDPQVPHFSNFFSNQLSSLTFLTCLLNRPLINESDLHSTFEKRLSIFRTQAVFEKHNAFRCSPNLINWSTWFITSKMFPLAQLFKWTGSNADEEFNSRSTCTILLVRTSIIQRGVKRKLFSVHTIQVKLYLVCNEWKSNLYKSKNIRR